MFEFDEYGRPKWPPEDPMLQRLEQQTAPAPEPDPAPTGYAGRGASANPALSMAGVSTEGPLADEAAQTAQNYDPGAYEEGGVSRHLPQQYGQAGTPYNPDEGPLSPQETAARMPQTAGGMEELIRKHMLPMNPALKAMSPEARQQVLARKREQDDAQRMQRRQMQGGMNGFVGQTMPSVHNIGGFNFVQGSWRPMDAMERAKLRLTNATADLTQQKPDLQREGFNLRATLDAARRGDRVALEMLRQQGMDDRLIKTLGQKQDQFGKQMDFKQQQAESLNDYRKQRLGLAQQMVDRANAVLESRDAKAAQKLALDTQGALDRTIAELKAREGAAQRDDSWNVTKMIGLGKDPKALRDRTFDKNGKPGNTLSGSYDVLADEALRYSDILYSLHDAAPGAVKPPSPDVAEMLKRLRQERGQAETSP